MNQGMNDLKCGDRMEWEGLRIPCGIVADYQDVAMSSTAIFQWPHNIHGDPPKRCRNDRERLQECSAPLGHSTCLLADVTCYSVFVRQCIVWASKIVS